MTEKEVKNKITEHKQKNQDQKHCCTINQEYKPYNTHLLLTSPTDQKGTLKIN